MFRYEQFAQNNLTIVDDDGLDGTNLNRYVLSTSANAGDPKAPFLAEFLRKAGHGALGFEGKWEDYLNRLPLPAQEPSLAALEEDFKFEIILSCVDKNVARHSLQCSYPRIILGASTLDFRAQVVTHDMGASTACLKCHNPVEAAPIAVDALANQLRQATPAEISLLAKTHGIAIDEINAFIAQDVKCGMLSPEALTRLNGAESHEMSVGFTSVAAGIFLFREMILTSHGKAAHKDGRIGFSFGFDPLYGEEWRLAKNPKCDCSNDGLGAKAYRSRWSHGNGPLKALN